MPEPSRATSPAMTQFLLGFRRFSRKVAWVIAFFLIVLVVFWDSIVIATRPGEHGVYWSRFLGGTTQLILGEGTHLKLPWDKIIIYSTRVHEFTDQLQLLSRDGLAIDTRWSVRYRPVREDLPMLHQKIGPWYAQKLVIPEVISSIRGVIGQLSADMIYSRGENALSREIEAACKERLRRNHVILDRVLLLGIRLPEGLSVSINEKMISEQNLLAYVFRLKTEQEEQERKIIEATGIRRFEEISNIPILKWRGLQTTIDIANSPNPNTVIMGNTSNSLPLIMGGE